MIYLKFQKTAFFGSPGGPPTIFWVVQINFFRPKTVKVEAFFSCKFSYKPYVQETTWVVTDF